LGALVIFEAAVTISGVAVAQAPSVPSPPLASSDSFPAWAYPWAPDFKAAPDDGIPRHVPDSTAAFTITQERDLFFAPDWHPGDHPPMPDVVAHGRPPDVRACGACHRVEGAVRRTPAWPGSRRPTSRNKWPTTKAAPENLPVPSEVRRC
jgi:hypothetical protein